jgi:hypothetical protein
MTIVSIKDVVEHCRIYSCDLKVAEVLGCPVNLVQACRPMVFSKVKHKKDLGFDKDTGEHCEFTQRYRLDAEAIKVSSQQLLIKQLQTGHHWLSNERFFDVVSKLKPELGLV